MYQGNNPSALRSREEIVNAFMTLLQHSSIDRITIKQIMDTAGLSRQTFYQIFSSKEEILEYYLDSVFGKFTAHYRINTVHNLCDSAAEITVYCKANAGSICKEKNLCITLSVKPAQSRSRNMPLPLSYAAWWQCWNNGFGKAPKAD